MKNNNETYIITTVLDSEYTYITYKNGKLTTDSVCTNIPLKINPIVNINGIKNLFVGLRIRGYQLKTVDDKGNINFKFIAIEIQHSLFNSKTEELIWLQSQKIQTIEFYNLDYTDKDKAAKTLEKSSIAQGFPIIGIEIRKDNIKKDTERLYIPIK